MSTSRRSLLKMLPMAALAGTAFKVGNVESQVIETRPDKRYIFKVNGDYCTQQDLMDFKDGLIAKGYPKNTLVIQGDVDIFEVQ